MESENKIQLGTPVETHLYDKEVSYWANFYEKNEFKSGSSFFELVNSLPELPNMIMDIGCGEGRDSFSFARAGRKVMGIDRSISGVANANERVTGSDMQSGDIYFSRCDVSDKSDLELNLNIAREMAGDDSICYYMRFFLHSIPEDAQEILMQEISHHAKPNDVLCAEFRTDKDTMQKKEFGNSHYRRYQNANTFSQKLTAKYGWTIVSEVEDSGLSPYGDEDPILYRTVSVKE